MEIISEFMIAFLGITAIWLTQQSKEDWKKYACLFGICSQPFWFYSAIYAEQWGIVAVCLGYTGVWALGVYHNWIAKEVKVTRFEVIDNKEGRIVVRHGVDTELSYQDEGRTLKVFIKDL